MLGTLRVILAVMVVANHLWSPVLFQIGAHAVTAFYIISGFLVTKIRYEVYLGPTGTLRFFVNRALRIYPAYWVVCILTLLGLIVFPNYFGAVHAAIKIPATASEWATNIGIWGLLYAPLRLVPPAWSLNVEIIFYALIGLGLARQRLLTYAWFIGSLAYTAYLMWSGAAFDARYTPPGAASVFFAAGASLYHLLRGRSQKRLMEFSFASASLFIGTGALFVLAPLLAGTVGFRTDFEGYYGSAVLFVFLLTLALRFQPSCWQHVDRLLGDLAYPIFLGHFFAAGLTDLFTGGSLERLSWGHFLLSLFFSFAIAYGINACVGTAVDRLRDRVRPLRNVDSGRRAPMRLSREME